MNHLPWSVLGTSSEREPQAHHNTHTSKTNVTKHSHGRFCIQPKHRHTQLSTHFIHPPTHILNPTPPPPFPKAVSNLQTMGARCNSVPYHTSSVSSWAGLLSRNRRLQMSDASAGPVTASLLPIFKLQPITLQQLTPEGKALLRARQATANVAWAEEEEKEDSKVDDHAHGRGHHGHGHGHGRDRHPSRQRGQSQQVTSMKRSSTSAVPSPRTDHLAHKAHGKKRATLGSLSHLQPQGGGSLTNVRASEATLPAGPSNPRWSTSSTDLRKELGTSLAAIELHSNALKETLALASQLCPTSGTRTAQYRRKLGVSKLRSVLARFDSRALQRAIATWVRLTKVLADAAKRRQVQRYVHGPRLVVRAPY